MDKFYDDGVIKAGIAVDEGGSGDISTLLVQPSTPIILARNAELRKNPGAIRDLGKGQEGGSWGRQVASIPIVMFEKAIRDGYQLNCKDTEIASREMHRYLMSEEGKLCLIQGK